MNIATFATTAICYSRHTTFMTSQAETALNSNAFNFIGRDVEVQSYGFPLVGARGNLSAQLLVEHGTISIQR